MFRHLGEVVGARFCELRGGIAGDGGRLWVIAGWEEDEMVERGLLVWFCRGWKS